MVAEGILGLYLLSTRHPEPQQPPPGLKRKHSGVSILTEYPAWVNDRIMDEFPGQLIRVKVTHGEVFPIEGWPPNFDQSDELLEKARKKDREVILQYGGKTFGGDEFNLASWVWQRFPNLREPNTLMDSDSGFTNLLLEYEAAVAEHYLADKRYAGVIKRVHIGNEALSPNLEVSAGRHFSHRFNLKEIKRAREKSAFEVDFMQNIPTDYSPRDFYKALLAFQGVEQVSLNFYNQIGPHFQELLAWNRLKGLTYLAKLLGKKLIIEEYQIAAWLNGKVDLKKITDKNELYHFDPKICTEGIEKMEGIDPDLDILYWDLQQLYVRRQSGRIEALYKLIA